MVRAIFIVPLQYGEPQFPGVGYLFGDKPDVPTPGYGYTVGCATPKPGDPQFVTVWLNTSQANIDVLKARPECVWLTDLDDDGAWVSTATTPTQASQLATKVRDGLKYNSAKYAQAMTAIQAARTSKAAAEACATKLFNMTAAQIAGTFGAHPPKDGREETPVVIKASETRIAEEQVPRLGKCKHCGNLVYDVGTCPHCGAPIPATLAKPKRLRKAKR